MNTENRVTTRDITRDYGFGHGDVMRCVRSLVDKNLVLSVGFHRHQNPQNKQRYDMFSLLKSDTGLLLGELEKSNKVYPVKTISKALRSHVMQKFNCQCNFCMSNENVDVKMIDKSGRIGANNLYVVCGDCFNGVK